MKPWWKSRTVWLALLTGALAALNAHLEFITNAQHMSATLAIIAFLQVVLRFMSRDTIGKAESDG